MSKIITRYPERRRVPRVSVEFPVVVNWGKKKFKWLAREISEYGILLKGGEKELVGQDLKLEIPVGPNESPLRVEGVAAYETKTGGLGVRFKNLSAEDQISLRHYAKLKGIGVGPATKPSPTQTGRAGAK